VTLVVADTGPIRYLVLTEQIEVLPRLFGRIILPASVIGELTHAGAPPAVSTWARALPPWVEVRRTSVPVPLNDLGPGESEAIALAIELDAAVLLDEAEARSRALRLGLAVSGTVGLLERAAERGMLDLKDALTRLLRTNFRIAPNLIQDALQRDAARRIQE
jgi:predicted nucleic acid-binding protein